MVLGVPILKHFRVHSEIHKVTTVLSAKGLEYDFSKGKNCFSKCVFIENRCLKYTGILVSSNEIKVRWE